MHATAGPGEEATVNPRPRGAARVKLGLRAFRSLLVLMPLLGTPHVLLLLAPSRGTLAVVFAYVRAIVLSTQGLVVTIIYCFLNSEVQDSISNHVERWKSTRDMPLTSTGVHPLKTLDPLANNTAGDSDRVLDTTLGPTQAADSSACLSSSAEELQEGGKRGEVLRVDQDLLPLFPPVFPVSSHSSPFRPQDVINTSSPIRARKVLRQTTISNPEELEGVHAQTLASCLKCSSYPQLTDSELHILTQEGHSAGRHKLM
ncbi:uncharacterized protein LOC123514363 isoform X2 [Portunus trituberculatus]|uniref:uncharacterized protein LOC123514363 isoform X2 n=1 Tax=Portunus trituberculatus TaxID=210409 RepID=UPI001E1CCA72|nr:uncharacterized protein LOC123514363 isoform X2 [Portunus trituberculatus]